MEKAINTSETDTHDFSLIKGTFDFEDAIDILMTAYNTKINFHKLKAWIKSERCEVGGDPHTARALELQIESEKIRKLLKENTQKGMKINITCGVKLEFESEEKYHVSKQELVHSH